MSSYRRSLRFDGVIPLHYAALFKDSLPALLVARGTLFVVFRLYEGLWRYTSVRDLRNILLSVGLSSLAFFLFIEEGVGLSYYPRSILLIDALLLTCFSGGVRFIARAHRDLVAETGGRKVLIYGAGDAGEAVVREMRLSLSTDYNPVGFVDDDRTKVGERIHGIPVLGTRDDLPAIMKRYQPDEVLVTIPRADPSTYRAVVRALEPFAVPIKTLPHLREILDGHVSTSQIRDLSLADLLLAQVGLSRQPLLGLIEGKTILVTGAGGSIGAELCRQIAALGPAALILYERHENSLYSVLNDLTAGSAVAIHAAIGDVTDRSRFESVLQEHRPHIVFHAAAHKHVPLMELNICEAVKNNVLGTETAIELAEQCGSSDSPDFERKSVNPSGVMGATKRVAELMPRPALERPHQSHRPRGNVSAATVAYPLVCRTQTRGPYRPASDGRATSAHPEAVQLVPECGGDRSPINLRAEWESPYGCGLRGDLIRLDSGPTKCRSPLSACVQARSSTKSSSDRTKSRGRRRLRASCRFAQAARPTGRCCRRRSEDSNGLRSVGTPTPSWHS